MQQLIEITQETAIEAFTGGTLEKLLGQVEKEARSITPDLTTAKGRKDIASLASKVSKTKTFLEGVGKDLVADWKGRAAIVDQKRRLSKDTLDALKIEVRKPLTEWEDKERARTNKIESSITEMEEKGLRSTKNWMELSVATLNEMMNSTMAIVVDETWEEYEVQAGEAQKVAIEAITAALGKRIKHDEEQAELAVLRKQQAEQEEKIKSAASKHAIDDAAAKKADEITQQAQKREAEAVQKAKDAEDNAAIQADAAVRRERERADQSRRDKEAEDARRAADVEHRRGVNNKALTALLDNTDLTEKQAKTVIFLVSDSKIPNITINY